MKKKLFSGLIATVLVGFLFVSCSKIPQLEIDTANAAIEEAKSAGAEMYVHDSYVILVDSMKSVMENIEAQKSKIFKNYKVEKVNLVNITTLAQEVKQQAIDKKEQLKQEILTTISEVNTLIATNRELLKQAPKGKEGASALVIIGEELNEIEVLLNLVNKMMEQEEYLGSMDKAKIAKEKATAINQELQTVISKYKTNVKGK